MLAQITARTSLYVHNVLKSGATVMVDTARCLSSGSGSTTYAGAEHRELGRGDKELDKMQDEVRERSKQAAQESGVPPGVQDMGNRAQETYNEAKRKVGEVGDLGDLGRDLGSRAQQTFEDTKFKAKETTGSMKDQASGTYQQAMGAASDTYGDVKGRAKEAGDSVSQTASEMLNKTKEQVQGATEWVKEKTTDLKNWATGDQKRSS